MIHVSGQPQIGAYRDIAFEVKLYRDSMSNVLYEATESVADNSDNYSKLGGMIYVDSPGNAGTYTYKYGFRQTSNFGSSTCKAFANTIAMALTELSPNP